jgi:zinc protease
LKVLAFAIALCACSALAQPAPDIPIPDVPYTKFVLKNGLTVLVHEDHKLPIVAVNTWYHVGSKDERPGKTGFAHLFEHLMFSGSENFDKTYLSAMSAVGATDMNGTTNPDRTNYFENVPTSMLDYALFAESDRMGHLLGVLDQKKLDLQRGVVQNEKRQGENQPYGLAYETIVHNTYPPGHPLSWTTIGSMEDLDAASLADVRDWFKTHYGPNNAVLVLAGDITPDVAKQKVEKYYGDIPPGPPLARQDEWIAKRTGTHRGVLQDRVPQTRIYRVWNVPGSYTPDEALLDLGAHILGGSKTSRLYKRLVRNDQLASAATADNGTGEIAGQFRVVLTARPGADVRKMEQAAAQELDAMLRSGPTADELERAKTSIISNFARRLERIGGFGGKSDLLATCTTFTGRPDCYKEYIARMKAATPDSVHKAMVQWLTDGDYVLEVQPYPAASAQVTTLDRKAGPSTGEPQQLKMPSLEKFTLANGLKVMVAQQHTAPVVNISLLVGSGYAADPQDLPGLTTLVLRMMEEGTATRSGERIIADFEAIGAHYGTSANLDGVSLGMNALRTTLPRAMDIYSDVILHPAFPPAELERIRKEQLAGIAREKTSPMAMAMRAVPSLLYGGSHPYGRPLTGTGTEAGVSHATRDDLIKYHRTWFRPNDATLLVVGDTTVAAIKPLVEKAFGSWQAGDVPKKNIAIVQPPAKTAIYLMDRPGSLQSVIVGAQLAHPADAKQLVQMELVNNIFGGTFESRINMNLREDKHWTYGARSELTPTEGQWPLMSRAPVQADKTAEALHELVTEYAGITGARPITPAELKSAQGRETLAMPGRFETAGELAGAYAQILEYGLPEDYFVTYTPTVLALTTDEANALARRSILSDRQVWLVVGDLAKIETPISALNLGEVYRIDADGKILTGTKP